MSWPGAAPWVFDSPEGAWGDDRPGQRPGFMIYAPRGHGVIVVVRPQRGELR